MEVTGSTDGIRGQLRQGLQFRLNAPPVRPFVAVRGGSGRASAEFVAGGSRTCFQVELGNHFVPTVAGLYRGDPDVNGELVVDFSFLIHFSLFGGCFETDLPPMSCLEDKERSV